MKVKNNMLCLSIILFLQFISISAQSSIDNKVVVIIIDGARYSETLGDTTKTYTPKMWDMSAEGTIINNFYNDSLTYTSRAIPALWSGTWTDVRDTTYLGNQTKYSVKPSIFEYYRKYKNLPKEECFYVLKYIKSLWLQSFDFNFGPDYWPNTLSVGATDKDVSDQAQLVMENYHPHLLWIYLADVDHAGHSGIWSNYTNAIEIADSIVGVVWDKIQSDPFYKNSTTLFVTNDHGRHDDQHGGFKGHGDGCEGCRHIQYLALGPNIKKNFRLTKQRRTPDMAATIATIFNIDAPKITGESISEIFVPTDVSKEGNSIYNFELSQNFPNPFNPSTTIKYSIPSIVGNGHAHSITDVTLKIYDLLGRKVATLVNKEQGPGNYEVKFNASKLTSGIYFYRLTSGDLVETKKLLLLK